MNPPGGSAPAPPVVVIGLDSADATALDAWADAGRLPSFDGLRRRGARARLTGAGWYAAEKGWTELLTGRRAERTGAWTDLRFDPADYAVRQTGAYGFDEFPPFYALGSDHRVAVFDVPQTQIVGGVDGVQALAWGAHSPRGVTTSLPSGLMDELRTSHGSHPAMGRDHASFWNPVACRMLLRNLRTGTRRRAAICRDLLGRERWDLFFTVFGEPHSAGHYFWHRTDRRHPLHRHRATGADPVLDVYRAVDQALGEILDAAPSGTSVVLFSQEGMEPNRADLPSIVFLPELLFRFEHPGAIGLRGEGAPAAPPSVIRRPRSLAWHREVYARRYDPHPLRRRLRSVLPLELVSRWEGRSPPGAGPVDPREAGDLFYQPPIWYAKRWPTMRCFALPSFSEGYVRINLEGREANGRVPHSRYEALCEELAALIGGLRDARTGRRLAREVIRTRRSPGDADPRLPDADLIVAWHDVVTDVAEHAEFGRIGPVPYGRTGGHREDGFALMVGPGYAPGSRLPDGHVVDLAPTILALMGAPIPGGLEGRPLGAALRAR